MHARIDCVGTGKILLCSALKELFWFNFPGLNHQPRQFVPVRLRHRMIPESVRKFRIQSVERHNSDLPAHLPRLALPVSS